MQVLEREQEIDDMPLKDLENACRTDIDIPIAIDTGPKAEWFEEGIVCYHASTRVLRGTLALIILTPKP